MIVGIIGGGASGMAAALHAAQNPHVQVVLLERQARLGRKLLATGNGRCNLTNLHAAFGGFHGEDPVFAEAAIAAFGPEETLNWFRSLGLFTVAERSGRVYPYSDQANSVLDVLRLALEKENITIRTGFEVTKAKKTDRGFLLEGSDGTVECDKLIVACGGLAGTKLGGSLSGYRLLSKFGHRSTRLRPALVQLKSPWPQLPSLKGIRANCRAQILCSGAVYAESAGEVQFTEYGLSGPVIFEISRDACQTSGTWQCRLDLLPKWNENILLRELQRRVDGDFPCEELLTGILHNRLGKVLLKQALGQLSGSAATLTQGHLQSICDAVKALTVDISEPLGMDSAQVTAGGVRTEEFDSATMESHLVPGLYACGEVLDIDGDCGGYNLQWAWSSGRCAGIHAGKEPL